MKKTNVFITASLIFIISMVLIYGTRLIYFYKLSHADKKLGEVKFTTIINNKSYDTSISKEGKNLYYIGNVLNNYVYYSNRYFRIIGVENDRVILVDDISTILPFNNEFDKSDIYTWLNKTEEKNSGIYYNSLYKPLELLDNTKTCLDLDCSNYEESLIGLVSLNQYNKANNNGNYLKDNFYWLSDGSYVDNLGGIQTNNDGMYGVRAVITLKSDVLYYGGTGTYYDPYFITLEDALTFDNASASQIKIGSYISYSDRVWRVIDNKDSLKIILNESIGKFKFSNLSNEFDLNNNDSIAYYLNNDFYNTLNKTYLVKENFNIGEFKTSYLDKYEQTINCYVGMTEIGDLFINDFNDYFTLIKGNYNSVYKVLDGRFYLDSYKSENDIRPIIYLSNDINIIGGYGTLDSPFEVGEA